VLEKLKIIWSKVPGFLKNKYAATLLAFLVWMLFFDRHDLISQNQLYSKVQELEHKKDYYSEKIDEVKENKRELFSNQDNLVRFAREKYWMKRDNEDLFIIVEKDQ